MPTPNHYLEALSSWQSNRDNKSFEFVAKECMPIINKWMKRYYRSKGCYSAIDESDVKQQALIGLMIAMDKFNPQKENENFTGYASYWIRTKIERYVLRNASPVKYYTHQDDVKLFFNNDKLQKIQQEPSEEIREQKKAEFFKQRNINVSRLEKKGYIHPTRVSVVDKVDADSRVSQVVLKADEESNPEEMFFSRQVKDGVDDYFNGVSANKKSRDKSIVIQYSCGKTLQQIGDEFGITRERVRQIYNKHAKKLKKVIT